VKYQISADFLGDGPPSWNRHEVMHLKPPAEFQAAALDYYARTEQEVARSSPDDASRKKMADYFKTVRERATDKLSQRLGWMPRAHPLVVDDTRLIVPLYSDGFDFSLMALTDDWGATWRTSRPLVGAGNIQPSIVRHRDGRLYTLMRDNGPAPKRLHQSESRDRGETWTPVTDSEVPNPGSGAEIIGLRNGHWALISNDTEEGRHRLTVQLSDDEGKTWRWRRALENDPPGPHAGRYHYPSLLETADGTLHATYSQHRRGAPVAADTKRGKELKTIKHAHFNEAWVQQGDTPAR
jgi:predicted neuraminidase